MTIPCALPDTDQRPFQREVVYYVVSIGATILTGGGAQYITTPDYYFEDRFFAQPDLRLDAMSYFKNNTRHHCSKSIAQISY